jgi:hypothetical protein
MCRALRRAAERTRHTGFNSRPGMAVRYCTSPVSRDERSFDLGTPPRLNVIDPLNRVISTLDVISTLELNVIDITGPVRRRGAPACGPSFEMSGPRSCSRSPQVHVQLESSPAIRHHEETCRCRLNAWRGLAGWPLRAFRRTKCPADFLPSASQPFGIRRGSRAPGERRRHRFPMCSSGWPGRSPRPTRVSTRFLGALRLNR